MRDKRRILEVPRLKMEALERKQGLERHLEKEEKVKLGGENLKLLKTKDEARLS